MTRRLAPPVLDSLLIPRLIPLLISLLALLLTVSAHANDAAAANNLTLFWSDKATNAYIQADQAETMHDVEGRRRALRKLFDEFEAEPPAVRKQVGDTVVDPYLRLADLDRATGRKQEAIVEYQQTIELAGATRMPATMRRAYDHLAELYFGQGDYTRALELAQVEMQAGITVPLYTNFEQAALLMMARCHVQQGLRDQASNEFNQAWILAQAASDPDLDLLDVLQDESARFYSSLGLDGPAAAAKRAESVRTSAAALAPPQVTKSDAILGTPMNHPSGPTAAPPAPTQWTLPRPGPAGSSPPAPPPLPLPPPTTTPAAIPAVTMPNFASEAALRACRPGYPTQAARREEQGAVHLRLVIDETGKMRSAEVINSSGWPVLDQASIEAFSHCKFRPGTRNGQAIVSRFDTLYVWVLQD